MTNRIEELISGMELKNLDPAMLALTLIREGEVAGMESKVLHDAIMFASFLHSGQTRSNRGNLPRTPYIEHPLRNAIRVIRWGCRDEAVVVAAILHDTVEDCSERFVKKYCIESEVANASEGIQRSALQNHISENYGSEVERIVDRVTNRLQSQKVPPNPNEKREIYRLHVEHSIANDPNTLIVKFSDFVDNATGLYHNDIDKNKARVENLARKYRPLIGVFRSEIKKQAQNLPVTKDAISSMLGQLDSTENRLRAIISRIS